jgi:hypothetical protein
MCRVAVFQDDGGCCGFAESIRGVARAAEPQAWPIPGVYATPEDSKNFAKSNSGY